LLLRRHFLFPFSICNFILENVLDMFQPEILEEHWALLIIQQWQHNFGDLVFGFIILNLQKPLEGPVGDSFYP
jgi:hypothetical protein